MNHLLETTTLQIEPTLAKIVGLNESIFLRQLHYWINKTNKTIDGKKWVYNSLEDWSKQFPFWHKDTVKRAINNLKNKDLIEVKKHDKNLFNRTNYYTINYENIEKLKPKDKPIEIKRENEEKKLAKKSPNEGADFYSDAFLRFWESFPKKHGKKLANEEFNKLDEDKQLQAINGASIYAKDVENSDVAFIKTAKNWLKDGYYEDYEKVTSTKAHDTKLPEKDMPYILNKKIKSIISLENTDDLIIWKFEDEKQKPVFDDEQQEILIALGNGVAEYREMEFQDGEILSYLQGVLS